MSQTSQTLQTVELFDVARNEQVTMTFPLSLYATLMPFFTILAYSAFQTPNLRVRFQPPLGSQTLHAIRGESFKKKMLLAAVLACAEEGWI